MTNASSEPVVASWVDAEFVSSWVRQDRARTLLDLPRKIAAAVVATDEEPVRLVIDVASGAGTFLGVFLERFPEARGVWCDVSRAMEDHAKESLGAMAERTSFILGDMRDLGSLPLGSGADVVVSSRASHHLEDDELLTWYAACASQLRPGGWVANLDHTGTTSDWNRRWRTARREVAAGEPEGVPHPHREPLASVATHLDALEAAGFVDVDVAWRALQTVLFMGRVPGVRSEAAS